MKFGGTSIENGEAFVRVVDIVRAHVDHHPLIVVSAMSGVTDALVESLRIAAGGQAVRAIGILENHFERHSKIAHSLGAKAQTKMELLVEIARREIFEILNNTADTRRADGWQRDVVASYGERLSANLLTFVLAEHGLPTSYVEAGECILTDERHGNARPLIRETRRRTRMKLRPLLERGRIPVLGGFIAIAVTGATTTMGRGSSDYTATIISSALGARETQIWTDVDGILTADPRMVASALTVRQLTYEEAAELARFGARVLHPKTIEPVINQRIPIRVCNSYAPDKVGTLICEFANGLAGSLKAIAHTPNVAAIDVQSSRRLVANGFLRSIKLVFESHQVSFKVIGSSEVGVSLACKNDELPASLADELSQLGSVEIKRGQSIVACIGSDLHEPARRGHYLDWLKSMNPALRWQSTSHLSLVSTVAADSSGLTIKNLHHALFEHDDARPY